MKFKKIAFAITMCLPLCSCSSKNIAAPQTDTAARSQETASVGEWRPEYDELVQTALKMRERSYAPYSEYCVGAALQAKSGTVYTGCNVENASYPVGVCAERTAFVKAVSEGEKEFSALAIVGAAKSKKGSDLLSHFRSTIGVVRLNFSVRNGKRWDPHAMTTLFFYLSARTAHLACAPAVMT